MWFWVSSFLTLCQVFFLCQFLFCFWPADLIHGLYFYIFHLAWRKPRWISFCSLCAEALWFLLESLNQLYVFLCLILMLLFTILFIDDLRNLWSVSILFSCGWSLGSPWYWNICWLFLDLLYKLTSYCSGERIMF